MDDILFIINLSIATLAGLYGPAVWEIFLKWLYGIEPEEKKNEK